jgi:1-acyl-sn-glycerol-3-phosphate acyltransferase
MPATAPEQRPHDLSAATPAPRPWRPTLAARLLPAIARAVVMPFCRLTVSGRPPAAGGPVILAANHIGPMDPVVMLAACQRAGIVPRVLATGGLFRAPLLGTLLRHCGYIQVNRNRPDVSDALPAALAALATRSVLLAYPEGRITLDPGGWPERGRTGVARLARATGAPVVPVAQWGAHLLVPWSAPRGALGRLCWALTHRPVVRVHFGTPIALDGLPVPAATTTIMDALCRDLAVLRPDEPGLPGWIDPYRPVSVARTHRRRTAG